MPAQPRLPRARARARAPARAGSRARLHPLGLALGLAGLFSLGAPRPSQACGGLFCNVAQPVNQAAERILFARDGATMHMLVRLTYQGPSVDFGWLLPVPGDVESRIGSAALFNTLDATFGPRFVLTTRIDPACEPLFGFDAGSLSDLGGGGAGGAGGGGGEGPVQVISREVVGPYDQAVLRADSVADLRDWLTTNAFQFPEGSEPLLQTYVELGSAFLALKLVADANDDDVVPIHLTFTSDTPAIPLRPTAVAADPDMGILVHLLGPGRAVPLNFRHVQINEAAIDWVNGGANYTDVVSQAADEAGGRAFVTDAAQPAQGLAQPVPTAGQIAGAQATLTLGALFGTGLDLNDADIARLVARHLTPPEGVDAADYLGCLGCFGDDWQAAPFAGEAFAADLEAEVVASRALLEDLFRVHPYMTRLFTTMSADEMTEDPIFDFNRDLTDVLPQRDAVRHVSCDDQGNLDFAHAVIELADGRRVPSGDDALPFIQRQQGLTVRGEDTVAAAVVERMYSAGQPEVIEDRRATLGGQPQPPLPARATGGDGGCGCDLAADPRPAPAAAGLLLLLTGLARRRRR